MDLQPIATALIVGTCAAFALKNLVGAIASRRGGCAGCAVPVRPRDGEDAFARYRFACVEGPVMDGTRVEWEGVAE